MVLEQSCVFEKIRLIEEDCELALKGQLKSPPLRPARDISFEKSRRKGKVGLSYKEGQARLLHDLANIELQAMELGLRTLIEFPEAPSFFKEELAILTISESKHLKLCLEGISELGFAWGDWPIHLGLWQATSAEDSLLDRILIVHRYLEGSGLDAGETFLRKLQAVAPSCTHQIVKTILTEEVDHVAFGSRWYQEICRLEKKDAQTDFDLRMNRLKAVLPRRIERLSLDLRKKAGFTDFELQVLEQVRKDSDERRQLYKLNQSVSL